MTYRYSNAINVYQPKVFKNISKLFLQSRTVTIPYFLTNIFFFETLSNTASSAAPQISFHCVGGLSDAVTTRLNLIQYLNDVRERPTGCF
jgi:hypothetical protein